MNHRENKHVYTDRRVRVRIRYLQKPSVGLNTEEHKRNTLIDCTIEVIIIIMEYASITG